MDKYISFKQDLEIRIYPDNTSSLYINSIMNSSEPKSRKGFIVNDTAIEIMELINGLNTYNDVINILAHKYNEDISSIENNVNNFLCDIKDLCNIEINYSEKQYEKPLLRKNETNLYPTVASIELTNKCNLRCLHCYGNFGFDKENNMTLSQVKKLLIDLKNIGVRIIEFTGGDITMHPDLKEIIMETVKLDFQQIALLTNGIALKNEVIDIIIKNKEKFIVQIDLHSLDDNYLKWFTKAPNTIDIIKEKINILNNNGVFLRIATVITPKNVYNLEQIADYVYNLGIKSYAVSLVINIGRAVETEQCNAEDNLILKTIDEVKEYERQIVTINYKYPGFLNIMEDPHYSKSNCGALTSNINISPNGDIKLCTMDNMKYFNSSIGNVFTTNIKEIYDNNSKFLSIYGSINSPDANSEECIDCEHRFFCGHCMLRGIIKSIEKGAECKWISKQVPNVITKKFSL